MKLPLFNQWFGDSFKFDLISTISQWLEHGHVCYSVPKPEGPL